MHEGKRVSLFSWKGLTLEVWNIGKWFNSFGNVSVTVECRSLMAIMGYGPSKWGMNLAMRSSFPDLYNQRRCAVDNTT